MINLTGLLKKRMRRKWNNEIQYYFLGKKPNFREELLSVIDEMRKELQIILDKGPESLAEYLFDWFEKWLK